MKQKLTPPTSSAGVTRNLRLPGQTFQPSSLRVKKPLIPPGASKSVDVTRRCTPPLGTLSKAAYYERLKQQPPQQRRMGPTTSALMRPAPPFSRPPAGAALRVPPGAALRVMPPKKRVKIDQDENDSDSSCQSKNDDNKNTSKAEETKTPKVRFFFENFFWKKILVFICTLYFISCNLLEASGEWVCILIWNWSVLTALIASVCSLNVLLHFDRFLLMTPRRNHRETKHEY